MYKEIMYAYSGGKELRLWGVRMNRQSK